MTPDYGMIQLPDFDAWTFFRCAAVFHGAWVAVLSALIAMYRFWGN